MHPLSQEIPLYNIDSSRNRAGKISHFVWLWLMIGSFNEEQEFLITELGLEAVVLGLPWLRSVNPNIDWANGTMKIDSKNKGSSPS
jgi:hypothetical protein